MLCHVCHEQLMESLGCSVVALSGQKVLFTCTFDFCGLVKTGSVGLKGVLREQVRKQTNPLETDKYKHEENRKHRWRVAERVSHC